MPVICAGRDSTLQLEKIEQTRQQQSLRAGNLSQNTHRLSPLSRRGRKYGRYVQEESGEEERSKNLWGNFGKCGSGHAPRPTRDKSREVGRVVAVNQRAVALRSCCARPG